MGTLDLSKSFVENVGGNVVLPTTIGSQPSTPIADVPTLSATTDLNGVDLAWEAPDVKGISGYEVFYTPTTNTVFGATPLATVSSSTLSTVIANGSVGYYAVSAVVNGALTMYNPLVAWSDSGPTVAINPTNVVKGYEPTVSGSHLPALKKLKLFIDSSTTRSVGASVTNSSGVFTTTIKIGALSLGVHRIIAVTSDGTVAFTSFTVLPSTAFQVTDGSSAFTYALPPSSVATFEWNPGSNTVNAWQTTAVKGTTSVSQLYQPLTSQPLVTFGPPQKSQKATVTVDPANIEQLVQGFGGAMTESSAEEIEDSSDPSQIMDALFGSDGARLNMVRVPIGDSDFGDTGDLTASNNVVTDALQQAYFVNPGLEILAVPWSAPGWMKNNGETINPSCPKGKSVANTTEGPYINQEYITDGTYADYILQELLEYQSENLPLYAVSLQNEPHACSTSYPTMLMSSDQEAQLGGQLRTLLNQNGLSQVKILGWEHNWEDTDFAPVIGANFCMDTKTYLLSSPNTKGKCPGSTATAASFPFDLLNQAGSSVFSGIAYHHYEGSSIVQEAIHRDFPSASIFMTEATGTLPSSSESADPAGNLRNEVQNDLINVFRNWGNASLYWNLALDPEGDPHQGGCTNCRGMFTVGSSDGTPSQDYYYWAQFSEFVDSGAHVISSTTTGPIDDVAFQNPDGSIVVVALNTTPLPK
jgi:O-glycosyl hydrolase